MPITVTFTAGQTDYIAKLNQMISEMNSMPAGTNGVWSGTLSVGGALNDGIRLGSNTADERIIYINTAAGKQRQINFQTAAVNRWILMANGAAESGGNAGSNLDLLAKDDAGASIDAPLSIARAAGGAITLSRPLTVISAGPHTFGSGTGAAIAANVTTIEARGGATDRTGGFRGRSSDNSADIVFYHSGGETYVGNQTNHPLIFLVNNIDKGRISPTAGASRLVDGIRIGADSTNNLLDDASTGAGTATLWIGNASINVTSDIRLTRDREPTKRDALGLVCKLEVDDCYWADPADRSLWNRNSRGRWMKLIAQQAVDIVPWLINAPNRFCPVCLAGQPCEEHPESWNFDYAGMAPVFVKALQQVNARLTKAGI